LDSAMRWETRREINSPMIDEAMQRNRESLKRLGKGFDDQMCQCGP
jgi:hypothetical protein